MQRIKEHGGQSVPFQHEMLLNENKIFVLLCIFFDVWTRFLSAIMSKYRVSLDLKLVISMKIMTINILIINDWVIIHSINQPPQISLILKTDVCNISHFQPFWASFSKFLEIKIFFLHVFFTMIFPIPITNCIWQFIQRIKRI